MENFKLIKVAGKGSFGRALLVHPKKDPKRLLIIKQINISQMTKKDKNEALNEVRLLSKLRQPNIVRYRTSFVSQGKLCIVMDYASKGDLYQRIKVQKNKLFSEEKILKWFVQLCLAVKYIHDRRILHRDLKTQNIFLDEHENVILGDFGIARVLKSTLECAKTFVGTPYYLSPELCREEPYNNKSDIWSIGCILYELATLRHAFEGRNIKALMGKIMKGTYPAISSRYSSELQSLIDKMLQKSPRRRPSINTILKFPFIKKAVKKYAPEFYQKHFKSSIPAEVPVVAENKADVEVPRKRIDLKIHLDKHAQEHEKRKLTHQQRLESLEKAAQERRAWIEKMKERNKKLGVLPDQEVKKEKRKIVIYHDKESKKKVDEVLPEKGNEVPQRAQLAQRNLNDPPQQTSDDPSIEERKRRYFDLKQKKIVDETRQDRLNRLMELKKRQKQLEKKEEYLNAQKRLLLDKQQKENIRPRPDQFKPFQENAKPVSKPVRSDQQPRFTIKNSVNKFKLDGRTLRSISSQKDSLACRIESLRLYLEQQLGEETFYKIYQLADNDEDSKLEEILGEERIGYVSLVHQLLFCEDQAFDQ